MRWIATFYNYKIMEEYCDKIVDAMKMIISNSDNSTIEELEDIQFMLDGEAKKKYVELWTEINDLIKEKQGKTEKQLFGSIIEEKDWGTRLFETSRQLGNKQQQSFIYCLEPVLVVRKIARSSNYELQQFQFAMQYYYEGVNVDKHINDIEHLNEIRNLLENDNRENVGQIQGLYYDLIINDIGRYLEILESLQKVRAE